MFPKDPEFYTKHHLHNGFLGNSFIESFAKGLPQPDLLSLTEIDAYKDIIGFNVEDTMLRSFLYPWSPQRAHRHARCGLCGNFHLSC
jgi:hypothetical protein